MENLITRYRNVTILVVVLFAQVLGLAVQVKRSTDNESSRLIRIWAINMLAPFEKGIVWFQGGVSGLWRNYVYLRGVRQENRDLKAEIQKLRLEQVRLREDAEQARRLQALLSFKEQFIAETVAAQVIGSSGSQQSRSVYIDKGSGDGIKPGMAVITADGVVGKVLLVSGSTSQVLLIDDQNSGLGILLEKTRTQGILRGTPSGEVVVETVMGGEDVRPGEKLLTSGGDQIFPKGLLAGTVTQVSPGKDFFLNIRVKPAVNLSRLEEVLVITKQEVKAPALAETSPLRAADVLAQRLPSVPEKPTEDATKPGTAAAAGTKAVKPATPGAAIPPKPQAEGAGAAAGAAARGAARPPVRNAEATGKAVNSASERTATTPPAAKPATEPKPVPPAVKVSSGLPTSSQPPPPSQQQPEPNPSEDKPQ
jgi:rod shape-determining protein MreC